MFYAIIIGGAWLVWHLVFRIKVVGKENLIKDRGFVMVCNHISAIDPVFLAISRVLGRRMVILGKKEVFKNFFIAAFLKAVGVVAIDRGKGDTGVIEHTIQQVKAGRGCLLFPEGTRSKDGSLQKLKSGAFVITQQAGVDILPCRIIYKGGKMKLFGKVCVVFGKPITCEQLGLATQERSATALRQAKQVVTQVLENLLEENREHC